jgi:maltoporin
MSGYGGGIENFNLGFGKAAIAVLGGARPDIVTNAGNYAKSNIDARIYGIKTPLGQVGVWFDYAVAKGGPMQQTIGTAQQTVTFPTATGYAFGFTHQRLEWEDGYTQFGIQYGKGAASNFSSSLDNPTPYLKNSERFLLTGQVVVQPSKKFPGHHSDRWLSFGARQCTFSRITFL